MNNLQDESCLVVARKFVADGVSPAEVLHILKTDVRIQPCLFSREFFRVLLDGLFDDLEYRMALDLRPDISNNSSLLAFFTDLVEGRKSEYVIEFDSGDSKLSDDHPVSKSEFKSYAEKYKEENENYEDDGEFEHRQLDFIMFPFFVLGMIPEKGTVSWIGSYSFHGSLTSKQKGKESVDINN